MKVTVEKILKAIVFIVLVACSISSFAQVTMYVMKNGEVIFESPISGIDNVTFDEATDDEALIVHKNDVLYADKTPLNDIQQLSFSDESLFIEMLSSNEELAFGDIAKLLFDNSSTNRINNLPAQSSCDVFVSVTPASDVIVESSANVKALTLFSIDGKMISLRHCNGVEKQYVVSLRNNNVGVYLLRIETEQCTIVKKVVKSLNK